MANQDKDRDFFEIFLAYAQKLTSFEKLHHRLPFTEQSEVTISSLSKLAGPAGSSPTPSGFKKREEKSSGVVKIFSRPADKDS